MQRKYFLVVHLYFTKIIEMGVKDILDKDIFDTFFCLIKVYLFIRGPPYQFEFWRFELIGG